MKHICIFTYMHICISTRISQNLHTSILIGIPACIFTYMHLCIFTYVHVNMDIHVLLSCHWRSMLNPWCAPRFSAGNRHWSSGHCVGRRSVRNTDASFATTWSHLRTVPGQGCYWKSFGNGMSCNWGINLQNRSPNWVVEPELTILAWNKTLSISWLDILLKIDIWWKWRYRNAPYSDSR